MSYQQIPNLPAAIALNGSEQLEAVQAGTSVRVTTQQISNFARGSLNTVSAGKVLGRDTASGTGPVQELPIAVDASGNVGIGTSAPLAKFNVSTSDANINFLSSGITSGLRIFHTSLGSSVDSTDHTGTVAYKLLNLAGSYVTICTGAASTERMRIDTSGNVGIGTSSPSYSRLHVLGSGVTQGVKVESTSTNQFDGAAMYLRGAASTTRSTGFIHINTNVGGTNSAFNINSYGATDNYLSTLASYEYSSNAWLFYTNSIERMRITADGKVGIGTSSPLSLLEVSAPSTAADMRMSIAGLTYGSMYVTTGGYVILSVNPVPLILGTDNTERMRISATGNVGIGTGTPSASAALEVASATGGVLFPRLTTTQRDALSSPANGLVLYNITTDKLQVRAAGSWVDLH